MKTTIFVFCLSISILIATFFYLRFGAVADYQESVNRFSKKNLTSLQVETTITHSLLLEKRSVVGLSGKGKIGNNSFRLQGTVTNKGKDIPFFFKKTKQGTKTNPGVFQSLTAPLKDWPTSVPLLVRSFRKIGAEKTGRRGKLDERRVFLYQLQKASSDFFNNKSFFRLQDGTVSFRDNGYPGQILLLYRGKINRAKTYLTVSFTFSGGYDD